MEIGTVINGQLLTGCNNFAGEVKFLSLPLAERVYLSRIPEGTQKTLSFIDTSYHEYSFITSNCNL